MSPQQEIAVGREEHPKILKEFGYYDDKDVQSYVSDIGRKVVVDTERPDVTYTFTVLDSPVVNAFALPGGYIYLTRGLLALANSEAELAAVLAHEAGHITGRHSAERYSRSVVTSLGASVLAAAIDQSTASQALGVGSELYLKSYSRDQEHEADTLGIRYLSKTGYDPIAMTSFLSSLQSSSVLEAKIVGEKAQQASYFSTHPATMDRVQKTVSEAKAAGQGGRIARDEYLRNIQGVIYGDSASHGFVRGKHFIHPELGFKFSVPESFRLINQSAQVIAVSKSTGSVIVFDMARNEAGQDARTYLTQSWMKGEVADAENISINGMNAATASFRGAINNTAMTIRVVAVEFSPNQFVRFQIGIPNNANTQLVDELKRSTYSFKKLGAAEKAKYKPYSIHLVTAKAGSTIESLSRQMVFEDLKQERFMVLNGLLPNEAILSGKSYKVIR